MPVIRDIPLSLKTSEVLQREGLGGGAKVRPEIKSLIGELLASIDGNHLLEPAIAYEIRSITEMSPEQVSLEGNTVVHGSLIPSVFPKSKELAVAIGTIGPKLERQASDYLKQGEPLRGMLLDGIGSAAVDMLVPEAYQLIAGEVSPRGYEVSSPVNPGMPGFPIKEQRQLLKIAPAGEIGVSLTSSGIMVPLKSTSMVIGIGPKMARWTRAEVCARCHLRETCPYRIQA